MRKKIKKLPYITIVIVNLNGKRWLKKCLPSICNSDYPKDKLEVVLVDNCSRDGGVEFAKRIMKPFKIHFIVIQNERNLGFALPNNQGMRIAKGEIIVCLNNDTEVDKNWLKEIVKVMNLDEKIGIVQCNSLYLYDKNTFDTGINFLDRYGFVYTYIPDNNTREVFFVDGTFAMKKKVFQDTGGFDDSFFIEYDTVDLCWRARLLGYRVFYTPKSIVHHARGGTMGRFYFERRRESILHYTRNHIATLIKNYESKNLLKVLPVVISIQFAKIFYFIVKVKPRSAVINFNSVTKVFKDLKTIIKKRKEIQEKRKIRDKEIIKYMKPLNISLLHQFIASQAKKKYFFIKMKS